VAIWQPVRRARRRIRHSENVVVASSTNSRDKRDHSRIQR